MTPDDIARLADEYDGRAGAADMSGRTSERDAWKRAAAELRTLALQQGKAGGVAWECAGDGLKRYVTDKQYRAFTPAVQRWYKPYRCTNCAPAHSPDAGVRAEQVCSYPRCNCPFDAPGDPNWCARGFPTALAPQPKDAT